MGSAVLIKVLSHNYIHLTKSLAAFLENNAIGAYDHIMKNLMLLLLVKLGISPSVSVSQYLREIWGNVSHRIKSIYGIASPMYHSTEEEPLYGSGQVALVALPFMLFDTGF
jgi:hypothetical protein